MDGGAVFPGAAVPFGLAAPGPDMASGSGAGYRSGGLILGFSQTHVSGVGGGGSNYGNFRLTPLTGPLSATPAGSRFSGERASPGSYSVALASGVRVDLTATRLSTLQRYRFPKGRGRHVLLDATSVVDVPDAQLPAASSVRVLGRTRFEGWARIAGGFNGGPYRLFFALRFSRPFVRAGTFSGSRLRGSRRVTTGRGQRGGAWASFPSSTVEARVGLSFRSVERARANLSREAGRRGFSSVRGRARRLWARALARISVRGGTSGQRRSFASALYHSQLMPHDLSGENAWWRSRQPHYEDFYTLWDTFRTLHPLLTLIQPRRQRDMVRSLVDTYRNTGWLPDSRVAGKNGVTQVGSNAAVVLADAAAKGLRGIDWRAAYRGLRKDAEVDSSQPLKQGRQLDDYKRLGFMSLRLGRSASRTLEYAYDDFAVSQVARRLGRRDGVRRYRRRSLNWSNLWDTGTRSIRPRQPDGRFLTPFSPDDVLGTFDAPFFEGSARQWSTFVPHDVGGLIRRLGGAAGFVRWLDELFDRGLYTQANEEDLLAPYLYIHAGRPDRTADRVREILSLYRPTRAGLPGEDDAGTLSSWYVWSAIGLYPNAGQAYYYVGSPIFRRVRIRLTGRRSFRIDAPAATGSRRYVQSASLNRRPLRRAFITHRELSRGGRLVLRLGARPSSFGRIERPPSVTH